MKSSPRKHASEKFMKKISPKKSVDWRGCKFILERSPRVPIRDPKEI
jgi:hypothetical protein